MLQWTHQRVTVAGLVCTSPLPRSALLNTPPNYSACDPHRHALSTRRCFSWLLACGVISSTWPSGASDFAGALARQLRDDFTTVSENLLSLKGVIDSRGIGAGRTSGLAKLHLSFGFIPKLCKLHQQSCLALPHRGGGSTSGGSNDSGSLVLPLPLSFRCPLTLQLMRDPVITASGQTYERSALESWLRCRETSPQTREYSRMQQGFAGTGLCS